MGYVVSVSWSQDKCVITLDIRRRSWNDLMPNAVALVLADLFLHTLKTRSNIRMLTELEELQVVYVTHYNLVAHHIQGFENM